MPAEGGRKGRGASEGVRAAGNGHECATDGGETLEDACREGEGGSERKRERAAAARSPGPCALVHACTCVSVCVWAGMHIGGRKRGYGRCLAFYRRTSAAHSWVRACSQLRVQEHAGFDDK